MESNPTTLLDKPSRRILSIRYRCLKADICLYADGSAKRFLTIKNQTMRLSLSMSYRTLWMETFKQYGNSDHALMQHQAMLDLRVFNEEYQASKNKAMPKTARKPRQLAKKVISQEESNVETLPAIAIPADDQQPMITDSDEPVTHTGVIESFGINPRRKLFILLLIEKKSSTSSLYIGGNLEQELTRIGAAPGDRIKLQVSVKPPVFEDRGDPSDKQPSDHIYYKIEMENTTCTAHTA